MVEVLEKLRSDLLEQFKGKPNIEVFQKALARQLAELYAFFGEINTLQWLESATGVQLDGIGDIVVMSRREAFELANLAGIYVPMDDFNYKLYLALKIHLNNSNCTHSDIYRTLKMFWDKPLYYSEDVEMPAVMIFTTDTLTTQDDIRVLRIVPKIKAAGVGFHLKVKMEHKNAEYTAGAQAACISEYVIGDYMELDAAVTEGSGVYVYTTIKEEFTEYE
ncbi:MAG: DUF2612 domain-containing protein [Clostridiales bacterium]|jgi:hypothetical protein|nr:DUF2612 domain-containing protein [Clostridiales bacterium]